MSSMEMKIRLMREPVVAAINLAYSLTKGWSCTEA